MKNRILLAFALLLAPFASAQTTINKTYTISASGGTADIQNLYGTFNPTFEEIPNGSPATVSITVQGCGKGTNANPSVPTCDAIAGLTNTSTAAATVTKFYTHYIVTATFTGGTNPSITVNAAFSNARQGGSSGGSGTVTSVATTSPITGGPITTTGTLACATCVVASAPGVGVAHFAGSTQTVTSSLVALAADVSGQLPIGAVGSAGLSGTGALAVSAAGAISCATCATTTNGGALSGTAPVAVSAAGAISLSGTAGQVPNGATGAFTPTPTLGIQNTTQGTLTIAGAAASTGQISINIAGATANPLVIVPGANAGTVTLTGPTTGGTIPSAVTAPVTLSAAGNLGCATCVTAGSTLTSNSIVLGQGGQAAKVAAGLTTNGTTTLTIGVAGSANGTLALAGTTSGTATLVAPSVAGTTGNPIVISNAIQLPDGTQALPSDRLTTQAFGRYYGSTVTAGAWVYGTTSTDMFALSTTGTAQLGMNSAGVLTWGSSTTVLNAATMNADTALCKNAPGVVSVGNGASCNTNGRLKAAAYISVGTPFTSSAGCTDSALTGGASVGKFTNGATGTCSTTITINNTGTSPNGWTGPVTNQTQTPAVSTCRVSSSTTTTAVLSCTGVVVNDTISFALFGY